MARGNASGRLCRIGPERHLGKRRESDDPRNRAGWSRYALSIQPRIPPGRFFHGLAGGRERPTSTGPKHERKRGRTRIRPVTLRGARNRGVPLRACAADLERSFGALRGPASPGRIGAAATFAGCFRRLTWIFLRFFQGRVADSESVVDGTAARHRRAAFDEGVRSARPTKCCEDHVVTVPGRHDNRTLHRASLH